MRIAYISADRGVPVFGRKGCSIHVQEVIRAFLKLGARVDLFTANPGGETPRGFEGLCVHEPLPRADGDCAARERASQAANDSLRAALERAGTFDLIYERYSLWSHTGMEFARERSVPGVLEVNAPLIEEQATYRELVDRATAEKTAARVFTAASALIAVSEDLLPYLGRFAAVREKIHVIPNGVNFDRFPETITPTRPARPGVFTVGFLGNLKPWHGLPVLVEAFAALNRRAPATRLLIVGEGKERDRLRADVAERGLSEAVELTGGVDPSEVPGLLASMDVGVAPYPALADFYFSPLKVYEYMAAGLPVIASRVGQLAELIEDGVNGLLFGPGDTAELVVALDRLRCQPELRRRLGSAARASMREDRSWDAVARRILDIAGLRPAELTTPA
jgi:glycosyltransferase involved in cell wall biosynthesis